MDADKDGYGELVYTTLNRRVMPLIRYRSGDITRFLKSHPPPKDGSAKFCGGGMPGRRIEKLKGRLNEWTPTGFGNLAPWMFEPVIESVPGLGSDWQIVVSKEGHKDLIAMHVESVNGRADSEIKESLLSSIKSRLPDLWNQFQMDICKLDVKVFQKGSLRIGRKLSRLVDLRKF